MIIRSIAFTFCLVIGILLNSQAQESNSSLKGVPLKQRIFLGGNMGLQFGNRTTFVEVSPLIGYWFTRDLVGGLGPVYRYYRFRDNFINFEDNQYGGRLFTRYHFLENFFAHAEYELLSLTDYRLESEPRVSLSSVLIGGGYIQRLGRSAVFVMVLYNLNETALTPYQNPIIRAGFNIGL